MEFGRIGDNNVVLRTRSDLALSTSSAGHYSGTEPRSSRYTPHQVTAPLAFQRTRCFIPIPLTSAFILFIFFSFEGFHLTEAGTLYFLIH
jgi:hypothetical protein